MSAVSSLQIGGNVYDIYSKSAISSNFANSANTARNGNFYEDTVGIPANFNAASTYAVGAQVSTAGYVYSASAAVSTAGAWSAVSSKFARLTQVNWTINDTSITGLYKGLQLWVKLPSYGGSSGSNATMLNINSSGAKQVRINNGNYTTHYSSGTVIHLTYDGTYFQVGDRTDGNDRVGQYSATDSQNYPIILKRTTGGQETQTVKYASAFTYNPSTSSLKVSNISSNNITATTFSGNLSGSANSALTSQYAVSAGAAPVASHNHGTLQSNFTKLLVNDSSVSTWSGQFGVLNDGYWLYSIRGQSTVPSWFAPNFAAGIAFGGYDTKGVISVQYDSPKIKIAGGNGKTSAGAPVWWIGLNGTSGKTYTLPGDTSTLAATTGSYTSTNGMKVYSAVVAGSVPGTSHDHSYTISAKTTAFNVSAGIQLSAGSNIDITSAGDKAIGISARNNIANASDKSTYFDGTSAIYAKSATSATNAAKAADSDKLGGVLPGGYSLSGHNHVYKLSGNGTAVNVSAGVNFKPSGSNIKFYVSGNDIYISAKNDNSTAYIPSGFQISGINGTTTGVYYLSALKLNAGTNIGFTSASNSQITITAKDSTYTTANFITANKTVGVSSNGTNVGTVNLSAISFSAGSNVALGTAANNIITITAKDTTYTTSNFITATHLSNIQTASGYAADWNTNKTGLTNSAKSGWSAWSAVTANSSTWATNTDTKVSQTVTSDNVFYPILTKDSNGTTTVTAGTRFADVVTVNPSTKMVRANKFGITSSATMEYNTATNSVDFIFN